ncbi:AEC family transporter [Magnetococcus sp. PR-3]|uniref:AEC family transporter n=1 Tax=Magnetococcus sp. PR-3 TaxID=3120355 RepID=UPI002FCE5546
MLTWLLWICIGIKIYLLDPMAYPDYAQPLLPFLKRYVNPMLLAQKLFEILFPILAMVGVGYLYGRRHQPDMALVNRISIDVFIPALIFDVLSRQTPDLVTYRWMALAALLIVLISGLLAWPVARWGGYAWKTFVPPMMFTNSGNMGIPLAVLAFGEEALPAAIILFMVENTLHFTLGSWMLNAKAGIAALLRSPIILSSIAGLLFSIQGWQLPHGVALPITMLGQVAIPLMLFSLGVRLTSMDLSHWRIGLLSGIVSPLSGLLALLMVMPFIPLPENHLAYLILFAVLPPAVLNYMMAERFDQEPKQVAAMVLMGNLASVVSMPLALLYILK